MQINKHSSFLYAPDDPPTDPPADPVVEKPAGQGAAPKGEDWEGRYKGLQRLFDKQKVALDTLSATHQQTIDDLEDQKAKFRVLETANIGLTNDIGKMGEAKTQLEKTIAERSFDKERMKLIVSEYPELAGFEAKDLLPTAPTIEELKPKLDAFRETFSGKTKEDVLKTLSGAGGGINNPPPETPLTKDQIYDKLSKLAGSRSPADQKEYAELQDKWQEINKPK
jgi:hypothetical protein